MGRPKTVGDEALLEAARRVFLAQGHAATTRDVARAAGVSQAVLYQRYGSKDDLFFAAMVPPSPDVAAVLGPEPAEGEDVEAYLVGVAARLLAYFEGFARAILHLATHPASGPGRIAEAHGPYRAAGLVQALEGRLSNLEAQGRLGPVDAAAAVAALTDALHSMALASALHGREPGEPDPARVRAMVAVLWRGLRPPVPPRSPRGRRSR